MSNLIKIIFVNNNRHFRIGALHAISNYHLKYTLVDNYNSTGHKFDLHFRVHFMCEFDIIMRWLALSIRIRER